MNAILEQINSAGYAFAEFALPMLVQSSVLIVILLSLDFMLKKKVRAVFRYCIWMLVLVKLVLPSSLSSPVSFGYWLGVGLPSIEVTDESAAVSEVNMSRMAEPASIEVSSEAPAVAAPMMDVGPAVMEAAGQPVVTSAAPVTWQGVVFLVWLAVVVVMGLLLLQRAIFVGGLVAQAKEPSSLMDDALKYCCRCVGIRGKIGLKVSANATSPAVCGLFRPVILVPENLGPSLGAGGLRVVLLHELAHIKRGDLWVNLVQTVLQIIYFYNPLLWRANAMIRRVREQAVDETVQVAMGEKAQQYPETLVNVAKLAFKRPALSLRLIGVVESKSALKGRVRHMLNRPIPRSAKLGLVGLLAVIIIGAVLLPMAGAMSGPPTFIVKGTVTDAETGQPIAGAKVGDVERYAEGKQWTTTDANGNYSYKTWYEEHAVKCEIAGYETQIKGFLPKLLGLDLEKERVVDFALEAEQSSDRVDYSSVTVKEGVGFDEITFGCTGEFIKSKLGQPDEGTEQWLNYIEKLGLDFWFDKQKVLREVRLNRGFKGKLSSGISMSSTMKDVFDTYGKPIVAEKVVDDLTRHFENQVLYKKVDQSWLRKSEYSKIFYNQNWLLFWFEGERISQIVVYPKTNKTNKTDVQVEVELKEQSKMKGRVKSAKETKVLIGQNLTNEAVYRQLEEVVELSGLSPEMAFAEAIEEIRNSVDPPLRIVVMWRDLFDSADIDQATPINMDAIPAVRLGTALKLLLKSLSVVGDIDYVVEDGVILIATVESLPSGLEVRVYDISKLVNTSDEANDFGLLIIHTIAPDSWHGAGGEGRIIPHQDKKLVVSQTYEVHREIQKLLAGFRTSSSVQVEAEKGLVAYWDFNGNANDKVRGKHGVVEGATLTNGIEGQAYFFDGKEDYIQTPLSVEQSGTKSITMSAWVYPTTIGRTRHQVISSDDGGHDWSIFSQGGKWQVFTGEYSWNSGFDVELNKWQHIASVFEPGENIVFYKNGVSRLSGTAPATDVSTHNICIGANPGPWEEYFKGKIDEVSIYDRALSGEEVQQLYRIQSTFQVEVEAASKVSGAGKMASEKQAVEAASAWLELIDDGDYEESWERAAGFLKKAVGEEQFRQLVEPVRKPLGKVTSRKVKSKTYTRQVPGAPDGEYVVIQFETAFENKEAAIETVTPMLDKDGKWRVSGYYVR